MLNGRVLPRVSLVRWWPPAVGRGSAGASGDLLPAVQSGRRGALAPFVRPTRFPNIGAGTLHRTLSLPLLSFVLLVLIPVAIAALYYFAIAADQYVSEFRFSLRMADTPRIEPSWLLDAAAAHTPAAAESHIVVQYIASRAIIDELDKTIPLRPLFASPQADWWARLSRPASIEDLVEYWKRQVDPFYDPANASVTVRVRTFTPQEAFRLAQAIVGASERLVNDMSSRARHDALRHAEAEVAQAETRLKAALEQIRGFRDREGMIDPGKAADATVSLAGRLRDELVRANAELSTLQAYMRDDSPAIKVLKARIRSLETQRRVTNQELTGGGKARGDALSATLGSYEQLESERKFAEAAYQHALAALDRARAEADRQQIYIASFVPPSLPETALYPRRWRSLGIVALIAFAVWAIGGLTVQSIRDHF
jgi:capsular polysaccharide transport system permease protein